MHVLEQAKLSNLGILTTKWSVRDTSELSFSYGLVLYAKNEIIGPYFFENEKVTGIAYKRVLRYFLFLKLRGKLQSIIRQFNGVLLYYSNELRQYFGYEASRLIDRRRWTDFWPSRLPDSTPCDYFLSGQLKYIVHSDSLRDIGDQKTKIWHAVKAISEDTLAVPTKTRNFY